MFHSTPITADNDLSFCTMVDITCISCSFYVRLFPPFISRFPQFVYFEHRSESVRINDTLLIIAEMMLFLPNEI